MRVQNDEVGAEAEREAEALEAVFRGMDLIALARKIFLEEGPNVRVVINHQNPSGAGSGTQKLPEPLRLGRLPLAVGRARPGRGGAASGHFMIQR